MEKKPGFSIQVTYAAKGIAIILMLIHHLFSCSPEFVEKYNVSTWLISRERLMEFSANCKVCVAVFVFLTAYGIALSVKPEKDFLQAAKKRFFKLEKNFWVVFVIAIATCFLRPDHLSVYLSGGAKLAPLYFVLDGAGLANLVGSPSYNETWWYLSLAILLIFLIPVMAKLFSRIGIAMVVIFAFLPYLGIPYTAASYYLFTASLGIWLAYSNLLEKLRLRIAGMPGRILAAAGCALCFLLLFYLRIRTGYAYWLDGFMALVLCVLLFVVIDPGQNAEANPGQNSGQASKQEKGRRRLPVLTFIGKYSMNIFLIHTLIFEYYFTDFIYSFGNWLIITLVLLAVSLILSIGIHQIQARAAIVKIHTRAGSV